MKPYLKRAWAEISLPALRNNLNIIKGLNSDNTQVMAVVKADAYGHGEEEICRCLAEDCNIKYFAVSNLDEAISVRRFCPEAEILILGYTPPEYAHEIAQYNIIQGVVSTEYAEALTSNTESSIRCHVKIDTGMGRIGLKHTLPMPVQRKSHHCAIWKSSLLREFILTLPLQTALLQMISDILTISRNLSSIHVTALRKWV